ncbi:hypothetical protein [Streptomyces sp. NPDC058297]|uniref:hypothetical protein n=1 Tax=unclassified Streptomyces TaxID=2593676 RepID=UPI0036E5986F
MSSSGTRLLGVPGAWVSTRTLVVLGCAGVLLAVFVLCELRTAEPLIDLRLL